MKQTTKLLLIVIIVAFCIPSTAQQKERIFPILGSQIKASKNMTALGNEKGQTVKFEIKERGYVLRGVICLMEFWPTITLMAPCSIKLSIKMNTYIFKNGVLCE